MSGVACFVVILIQQKNNNMKNLILTVAILFSLNAANASNIGDGSLSIINNSNVELSLENDEQKFLIISTEFNAELENISMIFNSSVNMIQVYNTNGEVEMMLPIGSEEVDLGMSLFESGDYKLGFMVEGQDEVQFTNLSVK